MHIEKSSIYQIQWMRNYGNLIVPIRYSRTFELNYNTLVRDTIYSHCRKLLYQDNSCQMHQKLYRMQYHHCYFLLMNWIQPISRTYHQKCVWIDQQHTIRNEKQGEEKEGEEGEEGEADNTI